MCIASADPISQLKASVHLPPSHLSTQANSSLTGRMRRRRLAGFAVDKLCHCIDGRAQPLARHELRESPVDGVHGWNGEAGWHWRVRIAISRHNRGSEGLLPACTAPESPETAIGIRSGQPRRLRASGDNKRRRLLAIGPVLLVAVALDGGHKEADPAPVLAVAALVALELARPPPPA